MNIEAAQLLFEEAERRQLENESSSCWLYSIEGYVYCDLLSQAKAVQERTRQMMERVTKSDLSLFAIALNYRSSGRAALALGNRDEACRRLDQAVGGSRDAGAMDFLARGLLARAALFREVETYEKSRRGLEEAMRIAERGGMRLHQCDAKVNT